LPGVRTHTVHFMITAGTPDAIFEFSTLRI
jgi:hypothetical protein